MDSPQSYQLSFISFTRAVLEGMDQLVPEMRIDGVDGPIRSVGYVLRADDVLIDIDSDDEHRGRFENSIAETVLRGTWELLARYGFTTVYMEIYIDSQVEANYIGYIEVKREVESGTVTTAVPAATDT